MFTFLYFSVLMILENVQNGYKNGNETNSTACVFLWALKFCRSFCSPSCSVWGTGSSQRTEDLGSVLTVRGRLQFLSRSYRTFGCSNKSEQPWICSRAHRVSVTSQLPLLSFRGCSWWPSGSQIVLFEVCVRDPSEKYFQECSAFVSCLLFAVLFGQSCLFLSLSRRPIWWMSVYECHYVWVLTAVGTGLLGKTLSLCNSWSLIQHIKH